MSSTFFTDRMLFVTVHENVDVNEPVVSSSDLDDDQLEVVSHISEMFQDDYVGINSFSSVDMSQPSTSFHVSNNSFNACKRTDFDKSDEYDSDKDKPYNPDGENSSSSGDELFEGTPPRKKRAVNKHTFKSYKQAGAVSLHEVPIIDESKEFNLIETSPTSSRIQVKSQNLDNGHDEETNETEDENDEDVTFLVSQNQSNILEDGSTNEKQSTDTKIVKRNKDGVYTRKKRAERKLKRNTGLEYISVKGKTVQARKLKELGNCRLECKKILEAVSDDGIKTVQERIFHDYWALGCHDKRVAYVCGLVDTEQPKRSRKRTHDIEKEKFRLVTHTFHFNVNGKRIKTCKGCFMKVLNETSSFIFIALQNKSASLSGTVDRDFRGCHPPSNKHSQEKINEVINHISSVPKYKSHYTRKNSDRWYFPAHLNLQILYNEYKRVTKDPVSRNIYEKEFHKLNISFKSPKVDTCHKCGILNMKISIETDPTKLLFLKQEQEAHHKEADLAYMKKKEDKLYARDKSDSTRCYMFDLQQCLPTPYLTENVVFYKRQLWTYNLTVHDSTTKNVYCFMWHEGEGGRGGNQIATCIYKLLISLPNEIKHVVLYSDTCLGQNKNSHVAAMYLKAIQENKNLEKIDHKFMVSGHSHIECDIDHGMISKQKDLLEIPVYGPQDWYQVVRSTGPKKNKFIVNELTHMDFIDFSHLLKGPLQLRKKNNDGEKFSWQQARWFQYRREYGVVYYKNTLNEEDPFMSFSFRRRGVPEEILNTKKCYKDSLPISIEKKKDLLDILDLIPPSYHNFYKNLKSSEKVPSNLPDIECES